jgi:4-hydroxybenzoate polyprenyltransferase
MRASAFLGLLLLIGFIILLQMNSMAVMLGCMALGFVIVYPLMKRITWWPQAFLGLTFNFGALIGWAAVTGSIGLPAILLYIAGICWTLGYDTIYAHQDIEDDMRVGIKSTAIRLRDQSKTWIIRFYAGAWVFLCAAFVLGQAGPVSLLLLAVSGGHLWWQVRQWKPIHPLSSLRIFKSNRDFGLIILAALVFCGIHL